MIKLIILIVIILCNPIESSSTSNTALIILGQKLLEDGSLSVNCRNRVLCGVDLYSKLKLTKCCILLTGGVTPFTSGISESEAMRKELLSICDICDAKVLLESKATNTIENALFCLPIIKEKNFTDLHIITTNYHLPRSGRIFSHLLPPQCKITLHPAAPSYQSHVRPRKREESGAREKQKGGREGEREGREEE